MTNAKTYNKPFLQCAACALTLLYKPDTFPDGSGGACRRCGQTGTLAIRHYDIVFTPFTFCRACAPLSYAVLFTPDNVPPARAPRCPNCLGDIGPRPISKDVPVILRYTHHGYNAFQAIPTRRRPSS